MEILFSNYRRKSDAPAGDNTLYSYEAELRVKEKGSGKALGDVWVGAGQLKELEVSPRILQSGNVRMDRLNTSHADDGSTVSDETTSEPVTIALADDQSTTASNVTGIAPNYQVEFMGMVPGHVTFLGFMKDPSVIWIFVGCIIIIAGTLIAFILVYREIWCYYDESNGLLYMATAVRGTSPAAHREFDRLVAQIKALPQRETVSVGT